MVSCGNCIASRFALLCLVAYVLKAHHVVSQLPSLWFLSIPIGSMYDIHIYIYTYRERDGYHWPLLTINIILMLVYLPYMDPMGLLNWPILRMVLHFHVCGAWGTFDGCISAKPGWTTFGEQAGVLPLYAVHLGALWCNLPKVVPCLNASTLSGTGVLRISMISMLTV